MYGQYSDNAFQRTAPTQCAYDRITNKRVRAVMPVDTVIHTWAQRTQTYGVSSKGNVFFERDILYSYGRHFIMGQFVTNANGDFATILNADIYSVTTTCHQSITRSAIAVSRYSIFTVPGAELDHALNLESYVARASASALNAKRARTDWRKNHYTADAASLIEEAKKYAEFFALDFSAPDLGILADTAENAAKAERQRAKDDAVAARAAQADKFQRWQAGEGWSAPYAYRVDANGSAYCRVKGDQLETSQGARVPLAHAVRMFRLIKAVRASGKAYTGGRSLAVGNYHVDRIEPNGDFKAGCHSFTWKRVEEAARMAGVLDAEPLAIAEA